MSTSKSYQELTSEPVEYFLCTHGDGHALGFKGTREAREKAHNLILNFYPWRHDPPLITEVHDFLSHVYVHPDKLHQGLVLYFYTAILRNKEIPVDSGFRPDTEDNPGDWYYNQEEKEAEIQSLADQLATLFLTTHVKARYFFPPSANPTPTQYVWGEYKNVAMAHAAAERY